MSVVRGMGEEIRSNNVYIVAKTRVDKVISVMFCGRGFVFQEIDSYPGILSVRPSIDAMFLSAAKGFKRPTLVLLSGIGTDGTAGIANSRGERLSGIYVQSPSEAVANGMLLSAERLDIAEVVPFLDIKRRVSDMVMVCGSRGS